MEKEIPKNLSLLEDREEGGSSAWAHNAYNAIARWISMFAGTRNGVVETYADALLKCSAWVAGRQAGVVKEDKRPEAMKVPYSAKNISNAARYSIRAVLDGLFSNFHRYFFTGEEFGSESEDEGDCFDGVYDRKLEETTDDLIDEFLEKVRVMVLKECQIDDRSAESLLDVNKMDEHDRAIGAILDGARADLMFILRENSCDVGPRLIDVENSLIDKLSSWAFVTDVSIRGKDFSDFANNFLKMFAGEAVISDDFKKELINNDESDDFWVCEAQEVLLDMYDHSNDAREEEGEKNELFLKFDIGESFRRFLYAVKCHGQQRACRPKLECVRS